MKFYDLETDFTFGKFKGKTLREVIDIQPSYLNWCSINLDHFYISDEVIEEINSKFSISKEAKDKLSEKYDQYENNQHSNYDSHYNNDIYDYDYVTNNPHYNEDLDMDQQSIEFWNSI